MEDVFEVAKERRSFYVHTYTLFFSNLVIFVPAPDDHSFLVPS
jgi:hypothetical protein